MQNYNFFSFFARRCVKMPRNAAKLLIISNPTLLRGEDRQKINASKMLINKPLRGMFPLMILPQVST